MGGKTNSLTVSMVKLPVGAAGGPFLFRDIQPALGLEVAPVFDALPAVFVRQAQEPGVHAPPSAVVDDAHVGVCIISYYPHFSGQRERIAVPSTS